VSQYQPTGFQSASYALAVPRYAFDDAKTAFRATRAGKSDDGKGLVKAIISGPDVPIDQL
jgi:D-xylulose reductase